MESTITPIPLIYHGDEKHNNVQRELFIPAGASHKDGTDLWDTANDHIPEVELADAANQSCSFIFKVPDDFVSFVKAEIAWYNRPGVAVGNMRWRLVATYGAMWDGVYLYREYSDTPALAVTATNQSDALNVQEPENPLTLANLATGYYCGIRMIRTATHADDTITESVYVHGLIFTYIASH